MTIDARTLFPPVYDESFRAIQKHTYERYTFAGGRASGKSSFVSLMLVLLIAQNPSFNAVVLRKYANTLRRSVFEQIVWAIHALHLQSYFKIPRSSTAALPIVFQRADGRQQQILFTGCDDPEKLKSLKTSQGYFAIMWCEEKTEFTEYELQQARISILRGGSTFWLFETYNPPSASRHWCNTEARQSDPLRLVVRTTYQDVPPSWLGEAILHDIEHTKATNERAYRNVYLGEATGSGLNVFENVTLHRIDDDMIAGFDVVLHGIDWGYYPDPFQYVACALVRDELYIFDELRLLKAGNLQAFEALAEHMNEVRSATSRGVQFHQDAISSERITADSAEPKSVADFRSFGGNVRGAIKGTGSREAGYKWLASLSAIHIDSERCPHVADEFSLLEYDTDRKTGEVISGYPTGQADHTIDAVRYATEQVWRHGGQ